MLGTIFLYNFILLGSTLFVYLSEKAKTPIGRGICISIAFLIVFLPAAFRYYIGVDYHSYSEIYEAIGKGGESYVEPAYYYLNVLLNNFNLEVEWLFAIMAFLTYFIAFLSYPNRNKALYHYLYLTTFYFLTFTSLRGSLATSLALLAISLYLKNTKNLLFYFILIFIGYLFHKSVALMIIFPFLDNRLFRKIVLNSRIGFYLALMAIVIFGSVIIEWIFISPVSIWMGYDNYLNSLYHIQQTDFGSGLGFMIRIFPLLIFIVFYKSIIKYNSKIFIYILVSICCILSVFLSAQVHIFTRLERVFALAYIYIPCIILYTYNLRMRKIVVGICLIFTFILYNHNYLTYTTQTCEGARLSPYVSIFNKIDDQSLKVTAQYCQ